MGPGFAQAANDAQTLASGASDATDAVGSVAMAAADARRRG
jgi:hypothetical protein